ncbi:GTP cyclohydrolase II [Mortierella sp. AD094]|nr:GTP cyclohydrolase II [Mortierella sp. AD094]
MASDISMDEAPVVAHSAYIPRNAIDHMNPFFFKSHQHAHSHFGHNHGHHHHHHNSHHNALRQQPYAAPAAPYSHSHSTGKDLPSPSSDTPSSSSSSSVGLQTPVPRHLSVHADPSTAPSYSTPPATPPLTLLERQAATAAAANATAASAVETRRNYKDDPLAWCTARARIPTPDGSEYFLHIYENKKDKKEHLAFVFGDVIRSQSLDRVQPNETEMDRIKRGAYTGRLQNTVDLPSQQQESLTADADADADATISTLSMTTTTTTTTTTATLVAMDVDQDTVLEETTTSTLTATSVSSSVVTPATAAVPLVRIHSECFTGEIGHSARCDCGEQLDEAIRLMKAEGSGVVVYLRQEGRGIGLGEKLKAYNLQDLGYDTVMANLLLNHGADERTYEVAQAILEDLGMDQIRLLTNNPDKMEKIEKDSNIKVIDRVPMMPKSWEAIQQGTEAEFVVKEGAVENKIVKGKELDKYLRVKVERMRHLIPIPTSL